MLSEGRKAYTAGHMGGNVNLADEFWNNMQLTFLDKLRIFLRRNQGNHMHRKRSTKKWKLFQSQG